MTGRLGRALAPATALLAAIAIAVAVLGIPRTEAAFTDTALNPANSFAAAASFADPLEYSAIGPSSTRTDPGTLNVAYPAGTQANDLLLLVEVNGANLSATTPSGWTQLADVGSGSPDQLHFTVSWKPAGVETAVALAVNADPSATTAWVVRYTRPGGYPPNATVATLAASSGTAGALATTTPSPDVTTSEPDARVISIVALRSANPLSLSAPQGFTSQLTATQTATGAPVSVAVADIGVSASSTAVSSPTWAQTGTPAQWAWATVAFS